MTISARIVADSMNTSGVRITTMELVYPRFIHAELMTHRVFSRNASSSRAIPVKKMLSDVWHNPAEPIHWGANQPGMQANGELEGLKLRLAKFLWRAAGKMACVPVKLMSMIGLHKQVANRILEPWQHIHVVVTSTEWDNFYALRCHSNAQPEMRELAEAMQRVQNLSSPRILISGEWHLPYVSHEDKKEMEIEDAIKVSAARCARVSYLNHGGLKSSLIQDHRLYDRLLGASPPHMSPVEHQAVATVGTMRYANFRGWISHRFMVENRPA